MAAGRVYPCWLILVISLAAIVSGTETKRVFVSETPDGSNTTSLLNALRDPQATQIIVVGNVTLRERTTQPGAPIPLNRNVTITAAHGRQDVLDLQFQRGVVELCSSCIMTIENITVSNERRGNSNPWDAVLGLPGSMIHMINMNRLRLACTSAHDTSIVISQAPRSPLVPASKSGKQETQIINATFQGVEYPNSLYIIDYATEVPRTIQEGRGATGGYVSWGRNVTRMCAVTTSRECLQVKSPDACVNEMIDKALAAGSSPAQHAGQGGLAAGIVAAIVAPIVIAGAMLAGVLVLLFMRRRRLRRRHQERQLQLLDEQKALQPLQSGTCSASSAARVDPDIEDGFGSADLREGSTNTTGLTRAPLASGKGWKVTSTVTSPLLGSLGDDTVHFGKLLGAGSFGRVYRARWAGRDVAVKVIEHDIGALKAVENEVALMMAFNHPNVVRAYHCVTHTHGPGPDATGGSKVSVCSSGFSGQQLQQTTPVSTVLESDAPQQEQQLPPGGRAVFDSSSTAQGAVGRDGTAVGAASGVARTYEDSAAPLVGNQQQQLEPDLRQSSSGIAAGPPYGLSQPQVAAAPAPAAAAAAAAAGSTALVGSQSLTSVTSDGRTISSCSSLASSSHMVARKRPKTPSAQQTPSIRAETWLVQEFCEFGTLSSVAQEWLPDDECDEQMLERLLLLQDCAQGLQVLHRQKVVHGDLNARNVLVSSSASAQFGMVAKLADLGLSRTIKQHKTHRTTQTVGTVSHMPPELLRSGRMAPAADIYAFGIMMWELYTCEIAFRNLHYGQFFEAIVLRNMRPEVPYGMPADYALLMQNCWAAEPTDRPTVERLLECLTFMVNERGRSLSAAESPQSDEATARTVPLPALLSQPAPESSQQLWQGPRSAPHALATTSSNPPASVESCVEVAGAGNSITSVDDLGAGGSFTRASTTGGSFTQTTVAGSSFTTRLQRREHNQLLQQHQQQQQQQVEEGQELEEQGSGHDGLAAAASGMQCRVALMQMLDQHQQRQQQEATGRHSFQEQTPSPPQQQ